MRANFLFIRETPNFMVYESNTSDGNVQVIHLPKRLFHVADPCPPALDMIVSIRKPHFCNCEFCNRNESR